MKYKILRIYLHDVQVCSSLLEARIYAISISSRGSKVVVNTGSFSSGQHYHIRGLERRGWRVSDVVDVWRHYDDESVHRVPRDKD